MNACLYHSTFTWLKLLVICRFDPTAAVTSGIHLRELASTGLSLLTSPVWILNIPQMPICQRLDPQSGAIRRGTTFKRCGLVEGL